MIQFEVSSFVVGGGGGSEVAAVRGEKEMGSDVSTVQAVPFSMRWGDKAADCRGAGQGSRLSGPVMMASLSRKIWRPLSHC
jgi:hypothetical protein